MFNVLLITAVKFTNKIVKNTAGHMVILNNYTTFLADSQTNFGALKYSIQLLTIQVI